VMRRAIPTLLVVGGVTAVSVGFVGAENERPSEFAVEALPTPIEHDVKVEDLSDRDTRAGEKAVNEAVTKLEADYPVLGELRVGQVSPVYREDEPTPSGVSVEITLASVRDVTMDLVRTLVGDDGARTQQAQPSRIQNLRGLILNVSLEDGRVIALYPAAFPQDVDDPERETVVNVIDAEKFQLYPDGDPRGEEE